MIENKYFVMTLGCQMNTSDSQRITTKLEELGYKSAPEKEADLVVVNACSVRQHAVDRVWGGIKKWKAQHKKIIITGCVLESDRKKYADRGIDFLQIDDLPLLSSVIPDRKGSGSGIQALDSKSGSQPVQNDTVKHYLEIVPELSGTIAYIPIMTGCNNFCSYCAVPYTRGREVSRPLDDILVEINDAISKDFKEIWLLGQNVNSYKYDFAKLLKTVDKLDGDFKFNFMSSNPHDMTDDIIKTFAKLKKWTKDLHLPLQSGDDEILKKMNRKYTSSQFLKLVANIKCQIPNIKLSTDVIVGFPGETKAQFENTLKICKKVGFWKVFIGQYSPRAGTVSAKMPDDVTPTEKKRRWLELDQLINK